MIRILIGDCRETLRLLPAGSVQTCVTSPPYFGLRDYGHEGQIGLEQTPEAFVAELVAVFREVRRVLRDDGTLWLNLGDSYASSTKGSGGTNPDTSPLQAGKGKANRQAFDPRKVDCGVPDKNLLGIPWRVAFALQADGWYLRQDIIWHKPNPMPESVTDRCTKAHEYIFLLSKSERYFFDADAIGDPFVMPEGGKTIARGAHGSSQARAVDGQPDRSNIGGFSRTKELRNRRSVWTITTKPFSGAHFATFPPDLVEPCILAGSKPGDTVLDPFGGAGTTGLVADRLGRRAILCELNPEYAAMARDRIAHEAGMFSQIIAENAA